MSWYKVDDKLHDHRKARKAGTAAMGLWVLAGSWCADNTTDGFIPDDVCARWDRGYRKLAAKLVEAQFWTPATVDGEAGWTFHDWDAYQPTKAQKEAERAEARDRMQRRRSVHVRPNIPERSEDVRPNTPPNTDRTPTEVRESFTEVPVPDPTRPEPELQNHPSPTDVGDAQTSKTPRLTTAQFEAFWDRYPRKVGRQAAHRAWTTAARRVGPDVILAGLNRQHAALTGRDTEFIPHPTTWLHRGGWDDQLTTGRAEASWWGESA